MEECMEAKNDSTRLVLSYIKALDSQNYDVALEYLNEKIQVEGPGGETFSNPREFVDMLRQYHVKYDMKKVFSDGEDIGLVYDLATPFATVTMFSWYQVKGGKITFIQTIFDPRPLTLPASTA